MDIGDGHDGQYTRHDDWWNCITITGLLMQAKNAVANTVNFINHICHIIGLYCLNYLFQESSKMIIKSL